MTNKNRMSAKPSYKPVKPVKKKNTGLMRAMLAFLGLFVVASIAVFALNNDTGSYGILDDYGPAYTYIDNYNYEYGHNNYDDYNYTPNNYHGYQGQAPAQYGYEYGYDGQHGQAPGSGDGPSYQGPNYDQGPYYGEDNAPPYEADNDEYYEFEPTGGYIGFEPFGTPTGPFYIAGLEVALPGVPASGIITTAAQLTAALTAAPTATNPHTIYTRVINIDADITIANANQAINGGRNIWIRTLPETAAANTIRVLTPSSGRHFVITASSRLTLSDITVARTVADTAGLPGPDANLGGINVGANGTLVIEDGATIRHNRADEGGGVLVSGADATFIMNGGVIRNNAAGTNAGGTPTSRANHGGGVQVTGATSRFYMNGGVIGHLHTIEPHLIAQPAMLTGGANRSRGSGGGVAVMTGATFIMNRPLGCVCYSIPEVHGCNCAAPAGTGVISGNASAGVTLHGGTPLNAWSAGGILVTGQRSTVRMYGGAIRGNWALENAGGVAVRESLAGSADGGRANSPSFHLLGGYVGYNHSARVAPGGGDGSSGGGGGGFSLGPNALLVIDGGDVVNNWAVSAGGGVRMRDSSRLIFRSGNITGNSSGGRNSATHASANTGGGGVYMCTYGVGHVAFYFYGGTIARNISRCTRTNFSSGSHPTGTGRSGGGGIFIRGGDLHFRGPDAKNIDDNFSGGRGGGIFWAAAGHIHVDGRLTRGSDPRPEYANTGAVSITHNRSRQEGGGVYIRGSGFHATNFDISYNSAGVPLLPPLVTLSAAETTADVNTDRGNGGGIDTNDFVILNNSTVDNNMAGGQRQILDAQNNEIRPQLFIPGYMGRGGGIHITAGNFTTSNGTTVNNNIAGERGGGLDIAGSGTISLTHTNIDNNTVRRATGTGGGMNIAATGAITITESSVDENRSGSHGGGINAGGGGTVNMIDSSISDNRITGIGDGAGIRNTGSTMDALDSNIDNNTGARNGGGVYIDGGSLTITDTSINGNSATQSGGGVFMGRGTLATAATLTMNGAISSISGNRAFGNSVTQGGGGVFVEGASGAANAGLIQANNFIMNNGLISNNEAIRGGGVFISGSHRTGAGAGNVDGGIFTMHNGTIANNTAFCASNLDPGNPVASPPVLPSFSITQATPGVTPGGGDGGGVYMDGGVRIGSAGGGLAHGSRFDMNNGVIQNNRAVRNGGAVFLDRGQGAANTSEGANLARGAEFIMNNVDVAIGSVIRGNTAGYDGVANNGINNNGDGGGVFIHGSTLYTNHVINPLSVARFTLHNGSIYNNNATNGGGVYIQGGRRVGAATAGTFAALGGRLTLHGGHIHGNVASQNGGGVYLAGGHRMGTGDGGYADGGALSMFGGTIGGPLVGIPVVPNPYANRAVNGGGIFAGGAFDESTGARIARSSDFNVEGGRIIGNLAYDRGGGVHLSGNILPADTAQSPYAPRFNLNFGGLETIAFNRADRGGGVYVGGGQRTPSTNAAGGVIHGAELIISGSGAVGPGNHAYYSGISGGGGGVYVSGGVRGGGAGGGATGGILRFSGNGTVQGNTSGGHGGGVVLRPGRDIGTGIGVPFSHPGALLSMNGGHILGNTAAGDGGGLWIPNVCATYTVVPFFSDFGNLAQSLVTQPNTVRNNRRLTNVNINGNTAIGNTATIPPPAPPDYTGFGGGIWLGRGLRLYLNNSRVLSNNAGRNGGSVFLHAGIVEDIGNNILTMMGGYLSGSAQRGGGVYISGGVDVVNGAVFIMRDNATIGMPVDADPSLPRGTASIDGGGVYVQGGTTSDNAGRFYMLSGSVGAADADGTRRGNIAHRNGGGVFLGLAQNTGAQNAVFLFNRNYDNTANPMPTGPRSFVGNDADGSLVGNNAEGRGGGIFIPQGFPSITLPTNTSINFNHARFGGGVWIGPASTLTMESSGTIRGNSAVYDGGGLFVSGGPNMTTGGASFTMNGGVLGGPGTVDSNRAHRGGGVFVGAGSTGTANNHGTFNLNNNGDVRGNRATLGGGVFVSDGYTDTDEAEVHAQGSSIEIIDSNDPYINIAPYTDQYINIAPTSTFLGSGGRFNMTGGHIRYNVAGTNVVGGDGGGVWIARYGYFNVNNITFTNNRAYGMGGAIFTMRHEYSNPISRTAAWPVVVERAYSNIVFQGGPNNFSGNTAIDLEDQPENASAVILTTAFGTTSQPGAGPVPPATYRHILNNRDVNFRSIDAYFTFFKIDDYDNSFLPNAEFPVGARFRLYRYIPGVSGAPGTWAHQTTQSPQYSSATAPIGRVHFTLTQNNLYRLVEDAVPDPAIFALPAGHWYLNVVGLTVTVTRSNTTIPEFETVAGVRRLRNIRLVFERFEFHKTDHRIYNSEYQIHLLEGARFRLFRTPVANATPCPGLVTLTPGGTPNAPWTEIAAPDTKLVRMVSTDLMNQPLAFYVTPGFVYQLVEYLPPVGHMHPNVQWRIQHVNGAFVVDTIGTSFPATDFRHLPAASRPVSWFLGNFPEFELPLTGGLGGTTQNTLVFATGSIVVIGAGLVTIFILYAKKRRHRPGSART